MISCQARILNENKGNYWTTKECCVETKKRISIDEGDAHMNICSSCIRRFIRRNLDPSWYGWFDCDYPPEARVVGSKWYYDNVPPSQRVMPLPTQTEVPMVNLFDPEPEATPVTVQAPVVQVPVVQVPVVQVPVVQVPVIEAAPEAAPQEKEDAVMEELQADFAVMSVTDKKNELRKRIKEIQKVANPGKMTLKEIQAAFKQITDLKTQIHML